MSLGSLRTVLSEKLGRRQSSDGSMFKVGMDFVIGTSVYTAVTAETAFLLHLCRMFFVEYLCGISDVKTNAEFFVGIFLGVCFRINEGNLNEGWNSMKREELERR